MVWAAPPPEPLWTWQAASRPGADIAAPATPASCRKQRRSMLLVIWLGVCGSGRSDIGAHLRGEEAAAIGPSGPSRPSAPSLFGRRLGTPHRPVCNLLYIAGREASAVAGWVADQSPASGA